MSDGVESGGSAERLRAFAARHQSAARSEAGPGSEAILDRAALEIFEAFTAATVDAVLLKGAGLASLLYRVGERRRYVDVDLLTSPEQFERAGSELARLGYRNAGAERGTDDIGGVVHEELWLGTARGIRYPVQVELHRWLPGAKAAPEVAWEALAARRTSLALEGGSVPILDRPGQALQLATHAAQHGPEYAKGLYELSLALERWPREVWTAAVELAGEIEAVEAFTAGLRLIPQGVELSQALGLPDSSVLDWEIRHQDQRPRGTFHLDAFVQAAGVAGRLSVIRRALVPDPRWIGHEFGWARRGGPWLALGYAAHTLRAPLWAARAWYFRRRTARRAA